VDEDRAYEEIGRNYRYFLGWRHKLVAGYFAIIAGLGIAYWTTQNDQETWPLLCLAAIVLSVLFWMFDRRNMDLYRACLEAGQQLEAGKGGLFALKGGLFALLNTRKLRLLNHSLGIRLLYSCVGLTSGLVWIEDQSISESVVKLYVAAALIFLVVLILFETYCVERTNSTMATIEECKAALQKRFKTKQDVINFTEDWGGGHQSNTGWSEDDFIRNNIYRIVNDAHRKGLLDTLELKLELQSEAEANRINTVWTNRRSWIAIVISAAALIASIIALSK